MEIVFIILKLWDYEGIRRVFSRTYLLKYKQKVQIIRSFLVVLISDCLSLVLLAATAGWTGGLCRKQCCQPAAARAAGLNGEFCLWWNDQPPGTPETRYVESSSVPCLQRGHRCCKAVQKREVILSARSLLILQIFFFLWKMLRQIKARIEKSVFWIGRAQSSKHLKVFFMLTSSLFNIMFSKALLQ